MSMKAAVFCVAVGLGAIASGSLSARAIVDIDVAPPAPREEVVPAPRVGFVWAPGYWNWDGNKHVWAAGHWEKDRPGHHWVADSWGQRDGHWHHEAGHWD